MGCDGRRVTTASVRGRRSRGGGRGGRRGRLPVPFRLRLNKMRRMTRRQCRGANRAPRQVASLSPARCQESTTYLFASTVHDRYVVGVSEFGSMCSGLAGGPVWSWSFGRVELSFVWCTCRLMASCIVVQAASADRKVEGQIQSHRVRMVDRKQK